MPLTPWSVDRSCFFRNPCYQINFLRRGSLVFLCLTLLNAAHWLLKPVWWSGLGLWMLAARGSCAESVFSRLWFGKTEASALEQYYLCPFLFHFASLWCGRACEDSYEQIWVFLGQSLWDTAGHVLWSFATRTMLLRTRFSSPCCLSTPALMSPMWGGYTSQTH